MRTKEQIFEFIATELKNNNTIVVATFGISWDNVTLYDHRNELCFNWLDCCEKVPSDLINELVCSNTLPEGIEVTNLDKGRE